MASDEVAAGDGALRTDTTCPRRLMRKSSTSDPSGSIACARMPLGPGSTSCTVSSGTYRRAAATKRRVLSEPAISRTPVRQCVRANRRKPSAAAVSRRSARDTSVHR